MKKRKKYTWKNGACPKGSRTRFHSIEEYLQRFEASLLKNRIIEENGCWSWKGRRDVPATKVCGKRYSFRRLVLALKGNSNILTLGKAVYACHHCDVSWCVNPDHLFIGTPSENQQDCIQKGRKRYRGATKIYP